jgi:C4-dicarboxylate-specific signal transduction histidine kinase
LVYIKFMWSFVKHFIEYHLEKERLIYTILIAVFIVASVTLYWVALRGTQTTLDDEFLHREQVVTRAGGLSITVFVNLLGKNTAFLAKDISHNIPTTEKQNDLNNFMNHWINTPVGGVIWADKDGKVLMDANQMATPEIGTSVADSPYFLWAKTAKEGDYFIGPSLVRTSGYSKGKYVIPVASPIIINGKFSGVISVAVVLNDLTNLYLDPLKFSDSTGVYLIDEKGIVLSSLTNTLVGMNYIDYLAKYSYAGQEDALNRLNTVLVSTVSEGKLQIRLPDPINPGSFNGYDIAYSRVKVGTSSWTLMIASPEVDSDIYLWKIKNAIYGAFIFTLLLVVVFSIANLQTDKLRRKRNFT